MIHRRTFFRGLMALGAWPLTKVSGHAASLTASANAESAQNWPQNNDPNYWRWIRQQFLIPPDEAYFNTGTLGSCPRQVMNAMTNHLVELEKTKAHFEYRAGRPYYLAGYESEIELRKKAGSIINAHEREIALLQNATMGISLIANGLDLKAGDEVLLTDQEHDSGKGGWDLRAKRQGIIARKLPIPIPTPNPETVIKTFADAITPRTRVIAIPHITSRYGVVLPIKQICAMARQRGIFTFIDGAQAVGQLQVDMKDIGCDAYATSPHKWLLAPAGNGLLYVRADRGKDVWATLACKQWDNQEDVGLRMMQYGTGNLSLLIGFDAALDFHLRIGNERIAKRDMELANRLRSGLQKIKGVSILSPTHPALACAIVTYKLEGVTGPRLQDELWNRKKIRVRAQGEEGVRQSTHLYNSPEEIDTTLEIVNALTRKQAV